MGLARELGLPLAVAAASGGLFGLLHLAAWQWPRLRRGAILIVLLGAAGYLIACAAAWAGWDAPPLRHAGVSAPLVMLGIMAYLHLYVGIDRSVSVRILGELYQAPGQALAWPELTRRYSPHEMFQPRLDLMVANHWLTRQDGWYACTPRVARLARLTRTLQRIYGLNNIG